MPRNNTYISANDPISDPANDKVFSRSWFRFLDMVAKKVAILNGAQTNSATAGTAAALPALPAGYMTIIDQDGVARKVPYYNA